MKVVILQCGKTNNKAVRDLCNEYLKRLGRYLPAQELSLPDLKKTKNLSENQVKSQEAAQIEAEIKPGDHIILLDENGAQYSSRAFAAQLQSWMNAGPKRLVFIIGGPYGFAESIYNRAQAKLSLSRMTFSHQIIRALFAEQLYRGFSIINHDPYHHD